MKLGDLSKKEATVLKISLCVLKMESHKGHLKWKVTELESRSGVSRSLIYRYLGSTKEEILKSALQIFTFEFYGFGLKNKKIAFSERVKFTREFLIESYEVIVFYQKWRTQDSWIKKEFIQIENKFQKKLKKIFPYLNEESIVTLHGCLHGIVTAPFLTASEASLAALDLEKRYNQ